MDLDVDSSAADDAASSSLDSSDWAMTGADNIMGGTDYAMARA